MIIAGCTLYERLKQLGLDLGADCEEIKIVLLGYDKPVLVVRKLSGLRQAIRYEKHTLVKDGVELLSQDMYDLMRESMGILPPDNVYSVEIIIRADEVVVARVEYALLEGGLDFLANCELK